MTAVAIVRASAFAVALAATSVVTGARADGRQTSDDLKIEVAETGMLSVEHRIGTRIALGTLKTFDVVGVPKVATLEPVVTVRSDDDREFGAHANWHDVGVVRIAVDEPKGLKRGNYVLTFRYALDGVAANVVTSDVAMWKFSFVAPVAKEGLDGSRAVLRFVAAPTEPRVFSTAEARADGAKTEGTVLATLRRSPSFDELELVRPHVARGEAPVWNVRVDPHALSAIALAKGNGRGTADTKAVPPPPPPKSEPTFPRWTWAVGACFALLTGAKGTLVRRRARRDPAGPAPRALVPAPTWVRALGAGLATTFAAASFAHGPALHASFALVAAMVFAVERAPSPKVRARGPGSWLALRPDEAFRTPTDAADWMDGTTWRGRVTAIALLALVFGVLAFEGFGSPEFVVPAMMGGFVLVPLFFTATRGQDTTDSVRGPSAFLERVHGALLVDGLSRVSPWARIPSGCTEPDELRLVVVPKGALAGVSGIEVGLATNRTPKGVVRMPEVLVRVAEGSDGEQRLSALVPGARAVPGRKPTERVVRLVPRFPTVRSTVALVREVVRELRDRRHARELGWEGVERRVPTRRPAAAPAAAS
ncbi:MAG: hypothetical protein U0169_19320 [Polyangiaceae bacterium]